LYAGIGDGGAAGDPPNNAQNLGDLRGKIIRIDVDAQPDAGKTYHIPSNNPFVGTPDARGEIWALGVRNPWRWSFDKQTGDFWLGEVGEDSWEEIDFQPPGVGKQNYQWSCIEGTAP